MKPIIYVDNNHLYLAFQDFEDKIEEIYTKIQQFPSSTHKHIKKILDKNFFDNTLERQTNYINTISTYIDAVDTSNKQYFFHLYILPKDIDVKFDNDLSEKNKIEKIEKLSIKLFELYSELLNDKKLISLFKQKEGKNFLQLEADFYVEKLESVYNILLNYKSNYKKKIICSDKKIGIEIESLNIVEDNPLKNYQFINSPFQKDLIKFVYSTIYFLKINRLEIFKDFNTIEYDLLNKLIDKVNNLLLKISTHKNFSKDELTKKNLDKYFKKYENNKELKSNYNLFKTIKSIFYTQLEAKAYFFISIDLTKVFEKIVEKKLSLYYDKLFIGKESEKYIEDYSNRTEDMSLNTINYLLENPQNKIKQYPDFLIKEQLDEDEIYHIIDAKYKLEKNIFNGNDIRQILVYSILFNKEYSLHLENQKNIKKIIIYAEKSNIDINFIENIGLNFDDMDLYSDSYNSFKENLFESNFIFVPIKTIKIEV
ncbi:hypothetical protein [Aliarcobacter cryaerophilus]|uniref:hypothetical protein n=1 Tax=Aliarcobacter cryaerophilus TaxID=28198 RepID=UPI003DA2A605